MKTRHIYLVLTTLGVVLPYSQFLPWIAEHGFNFPMMFEQITALRITTFGWLDVIVSELTLFVFVFTGGSGRCPFYGRPSSAPWWLGVSFGLPTYMYFKEVAKEHSRDH